MKKIEKIVDEVTKTIYNAEVEQRNKTGEMWGRDAINSHYFVYEIAQDFKETIEVTYGISYDEAVDVFYKAWDKAHDMLSLPDQTVAESAEKVRVDDADAANQIIDDEDCDDEDVNRRYDIYVCEWRDGEANSFWDGDTPASKTNASTLEEFKSDAWSYCEFAEVPTIAILFDLKGDDEPLYYCSHHFSKDNLDEVPAVDKDADVSGHYKVWVYEWNGGETNPHVFCDHDTMATTLEEFQSDAYCYAQHAEVPTVSLLCNLKTGDVKYYYSPHFCRTVYN